MNYSVKISPDFKRAVDKIAKKHKTIKSDISKLIADLQKNPTIGTNLGQNLFKVRMAISGTNKGKSGGARVITYVFVHGEVVLLAAIYLKSEYDTVDADTIMQNLKDNGLI
jgi:mRNA-degrading endonuclease RelE of RelBE toxin-antitoxin system